MAQKYKILVINPGSTSTKLSIYENETEIFNKTIQHKSDEFENCETMLDQKPLRLNYVREFLKETMEAETIDAVVGRGGIVSPLNSGTYLVNEKMKEDLVDESASAHASSLGGLIAENIASELGVPAYVVDPVVVDEMEPYAKMTGFPGIERKSVFHALNAKAVARKCAVELGLAYENGRFVVAHMGGGISVGAHRYGRVIDVNDAIAGEGPFTPERCGSVPIEPIIEMCYSGKIEKQEMLDMLRKHGGMASYLGTNNLKQVEKMIRDGDEYAALVVDSMAYQVSKEIGAMVAALEGRVDAIILTGGLAFSDRFTGSIKQRVDQIARVFTYPGEDEMSALALGALRVLTGEEKVSVYE